MSGNGAPAMMMYLVRTHFKNGTIYNFQFRDPGRAKQCAEDIAAVRIAHLAQRPAQQQMAHVFDEAGRETWIDGGECFMVQFVDCEPEIMMAVRTEVVYNAINTRYRALAGLKSPLEQTSQGTADDQPSPMARQPTFAQ